jgi:hypothetical protein
MQQQQQQQPLKPLNNFSNESNYINNNQKNYSNNKNSKSFFLEKNENNFTATKTKTKKNFENNNTTTTKISSELFLLTIVLYLLTSFSNIFLLTLLPVWVLSKQAHGGFGFLMHEYVVFLSFTGMCCYLIFFFFNVKLNYWLKSSPVRTLRIGFFFFFYYFLLLFYLLLLLFSIKNLIHSIRKKF